jgi:hypothetical protein
MKGVVMSVQATRSSRQIPFTISEEEMRDKKEEDLTKTASEALLIFESSICHQKELITEFCKKTKSISPKDRERLSTLLTPSQAILKKKVVAKINKLERDLHQFKGMKVVSKVAEELHLSNQEHLKRLQAENDELKKKGRKYAEHLKAENNQLKAQNDELRRKIQPIIIGNYFLPPQGFGARFVVCPSWRPGVLWS